MACRNGGAMPPPPAPPPRPPPPPPRVPPPPSPPLVRDPAHWQQAFEQGQLKWMRQSGRTSVAARALQDELQRLKQQTGGKGVGKCPPAVRDDAMKLEFLQRQLDFYKTTKQVLNVKICQMFEEDLHVGQPGSDVGRLEQGLQIYERSCEMMLSIETAFKKAVQIQPAAYRRIYHACRTAIQKHPWLAGVLVSTGAATFGLLGGLPASVVYLGGIHASLVSGLGVSTAGAAVIATAGGALVGLLIFGMIAGGTHLYQKRNGEQKLNSTDVEARKKIELMLKKLKDEDLVPDAIRKINDLFDQFFMVPLAVPREEDVCPICLEAFGEREYVRTPNCGAPHHFLHRECYERYRARADADESCPVCRQ